MLQELRSVDEVISYETEEDLINLFFFFRPYYRFVGRDHFDNDFGFDGIQKLENPPMTIYIERVHDWSSSNIRNRVIHGR